MDERIKEALQQEFVCWYDIDELPDPQDERSALEMERRANVSEHRLRRAVGEDRVAALAHLLREASAAPGSPLVRQIEGWTRTCWTAKDGSWSQLQTLLVTIAGRLEAPRSPYDRVEAVLWGELDLFFDLSELPASRAEWGEILAREATLFTARLRRGVGDAKVDELARRLREASGERRGELVRQIEKWTRTTWGEDDVSWSALQRLLATVADRLAAPPSRHERIEEALWLELWIDPARPYPAPPLLDSCEAWDDAAFERKATRLAADLRRAAGDDLVDELAAVLRASAARGGPFAARIEAWARVTDDSLPALRRLLLTIAERLEALKARPA